MNRFVLGCAKLWTIAEIELRQRLVSRAYVVIVIVFAGSLLVLSGLIALGWGVLSGAAESDNGLIFGATLLLTVFLGTILVPVLSGGAVNGDRAAGTLATTQLTLVSTWQLLVGKVLGAWLASLAFVVVAIPFLLVGALISGTTFIAVPSAIGVLALEFGVFSALGVAWSSIVRSPVFSIVCTYLTLSLLSVGTVLAYVVGAQVLATHKSTLVTTPTFSSGERVCEVMTVERTYQRWDLVHPVIAANPYVVVLDALPIEFDQHGEPSTLIGYLQVSVRLGQVTPDMPDEQNHCTGSGAPDRLPAEAQIEGTLPTWVLGVVLHAVTVALMLWWGWARTRTPARRLAAGGRVA